MRTNSNSTAAVTDTKCSGGINSLYDDSIKTIMDDAHIRQVL
mgnify:CR=1 FL=1